MKLNKCKCRCGNEVKIGNLYIHGHNRKFKSGQKNPQFGKPNHWGNHTTEAKLKISQNKDRAKKISEKLKGIVFSKERIDNLKKSHLGQKAWNKNTKGIMKSNSGSFKKGHKRTPKGKEHWGYVDGEGYKGYSNEFIKIRDIIKKRDNYKCQADLENCEGILGAHHIDYNKKNNNPFNLIALCSKHNTFVNKNRKHWKKYLQMKIFIKKLLNPQSFLIFNENKQLIDIK